MRISDWSSDVCSSDLDKAAEQDEGGMDEPGEQGAEQGEAAGDNLHLALQVERRFGVEMHRQAGLLPGIEAALQNQGLTEALGQQAAGIHRGTIAAAAGEDGGLVPLGIEVMGVDADRKSTRLNSSH